MRRILQWFLPKEDLFFVLLKKQSSNVMDGAKLFKQFLHEFPGLGTKARAKFIRGIKEHEDEGDRITHTIIKELNKSFITPFDKEDIHNIAILLDDIIDLTNTAALKMDLFKINKVTNDMKTLNEHGCSAIAHVDKIINSLKTIKGVNHHVVKVHALENEADSLYHKMIGKLFERSKNAVEIIKYREIYDILEAITDKCEHLMHVFEALVVKNA
jgi:uncharacterized protein